MTELDPDAVLRGRHVKVLIQSLVTEIAKHFEARIAELTARVEALEQRAGKASSAVKVVDIPIAPGARMQ